MKALIVTCFESNEERVTFIMNKLLYEGYEVKVLTSDFSHVKKTKRDNIPEGFFAIPTIAYRKNLSIGRLNSHAQFAFDASVLIDEYKPDLLWIEAPCNSLIKRSAIYKKKHPIVKLVIDIIDIWPESLPIKESLKTTLPFNIWKNIRTKYLRYADEVVTECDLYKEILNKEYTGNISTIHWAKNNETIKLDNVETNDTLSLLYLGAINNIIDIDEIKRLITSLDYKTVLHIVGDGEKKEKMISTLDGICEVIDHGKVYDINEKTKIFSKCHAGLNIYKEGLFIGLTTKCIDYFMFGLPIINNIKGDTWKLVEKEKVGINIDRSGMLDVKTIFNLRKNNKKIYKVYNDNFSKTVFEDKVKEVIDRINK